MSEKKEMMEVLNQLPYYEPDPIIKGFLNDFIDKVFTYYNGRINVINTNIILKKEWVPNQLYDYENLIFGSYLNNVIILYVPAIIIVSHIFTKSIDKSNKKGCATFLFEILSNIIIAIIHELYHADQSSITYTNKILSTETKEIQVYQNTLLYVMNHLCEIYNQFNVAISPIAIENSLRWINYYAQYADPNNMYYYKRVNNEELFLNYFIGDGISIGFKESYDKFDIGIVNAIKSTPNCSLAIIGRGLKEYNIINFKVNGIYMDYNEFIHDNTLDDGIEYSIKYIVNKDQMLITMEFKNVEMITKNKLLNKKELDKFNDLLPNI